MGLSFFNAEANFLHGRFPLTQTTCRTCHNRQSGRGSEGDFTLFGREDSRPFKAAQLRSITDKLGLDLKGTNSRAGFGFRFDGRADTLTAFLSDVFAMTNNQEIANLTAFLLAFPGSGIQTETAGGGILSGPDDSQDSHALVGKQFTLRAPAIDPILLQTLDTAAYELELIVRGVKDGLNRSWYSVYEDSNRPRAFRSDRNDERITLADLLALASPDTPLTFTIVPPFTGRRLGVDRDEDGFFDRSEIEYGFDPTDPLSRPDNQPPRFDGLLEQYRFVHPGMSVQATFSAVDPDQPAQALTFSLEPDAPAGASINPTSGRFTWTPTLEQSDVRYEIRVRVTDNGVPPLFDVMSLYAYVETLRVAEFHWNQPTGTNVIVVATIRNGTIAGRNYRLQYKDRFDAPSWTNVGDALTSNGSPLHLLDSTATNAAQRFYRVVLVE
jgi:hypothetical protein